MFFWLAVLVGLVTAVWGVRRAGLYEMVALFVNLLVAVYLALFLTPTLIGLIPAAADVQYGALIAVVAVAAMTFLVLHVLCFAILTGQFKVAFPKVLDGFLAGGLGFFTGFLIVAFLTSVFALAPPADGLVGNNDRNVHRSYLCWWCDGLHRLVGSQVSDHPTQDSLDRLQRIETSQPASRPAGEPTKG
jgi:hypothetical protein